MYQSFPETEWRELYDYFYEYGFKDYLYARNEEEELERLGWLIRGKITYWVDASREQVKIACDYYIKAMIRQDRPKNRKRSEDEIYFLEELLKLDGEEYGIKFQGLLNTQVGG
jgi:hypothetical protein